MYHGEVQVAEEHLKDFLKTAETLQVKGLAEGSAIPVLADETGLGGNEVSLINSIIVHNCPELSRIVQNRGGVWPGKDHKYIN